MSEGELYVAGEIYGLRKCKGKYSVLPAGIPTYCLYLKKLWTDISGKVKTIYDQEK